MALQDWAVPQLGQLLPLGQDELKQIVTYANTLSDDDASKNFRDMLGDSPDALEFIASFNQHRAKLNAANAPYGNGHSGHVNGAGASEKSGMTNAPDSHPQDAGSGSSGAPPVYAPPPGPPPGMDQKPRPVVAPPSGAPPSYARPAVAPPVNGASRAAARNHTNVVVEAGKVRARDEQEMQNLLQTIQYQYGIYNSDIEPEHETDYYCSCAIHQYQRRKWARLNVQDQWSRAVMYPGEKAYNDSPYSGNIFSGNPYKYGVVSPYGYNRGSMWGQQRPIPAYHAQGIHQTIDLNNRLNREAQAAIDAKEPKHSIWQADPLDHAMSSLSIGDQKRPVTGSKQANDKYPPEKRHSLAPSVDSSTAKASKMSSFRKSLGIKSSEERAVAKVEKAVDQGKGLRGQIEAEERGRWPDEQWQQLVFDYQAKVGMLNMIADLRARKPTQYLHLLRAGYFEPIPVAWASQNSNPLKFSIESAAGWRGITPSWRGYEDTAEERLYWVLNHREGSAGTRMKPDFISEMTMARERMAKAVEPPPAYFSPNDVCHTQHTSTGYSKQVMPSPFRPVDRPENPTDDTMILLDVSGSMDFDPVRPVYNQYMITGYDRSTQPKNKDVAKAIIRRFADAMANHDHQFSGYDLTTFSNQASYIGSVNHTNLDEMWTRVRIGGGTRVMTGWQKVKELHFAKHSESATHHPIYGWQAGPATPMLRLLLLLDGEATDMDEFELDLLGLSWAHVTIFLIGVDGCPHHHRHANELQRISDVNHHVSFVDAQGNTPERFVTHELLKRHLGYEISMQEFEAMEELPAYSA